MKWLVSGNLLNLQKHGEMILGLGDFNRRVGEPIDGFKGVHGGYGIGKRNVEGRKPFEFCDEKELCVANTLFEKKEQRKTKHSLGGNNIEVDFALSGKSNKVFERCENNPLGVATLAGGNRHGKKKVKKK